MNLSKSFLLGYVSATWRRITLFLVAVFAVVSFQHFIAEPIFSAPDALSRNLSSNLSTAIATVSLQNGNSGDQGNQFIAQNSDSSAVDYDSLTDEQKAAFNQIILFAGTFGFIAYIFTSFCLMKIADRLEIPNSWLSWVPIAQIWVMVRAAGKPGWWLILFFIPLVNFVVGLIVLFSIPTSLNKSSLYGLLAFIPILGVFLYFGLLAFT